MKRKIITDQNKPLAQENPKDFSELLKEYQGLSSASGSGGIKPWIYSAAAAAVIAILSLAYFSSDTSNDDLVNDTTANPEKENDQLSSFELPSWSEVISVQEDVTLVSPEGVIIEIPKLAFQFADASLVNDSIKIGLTHYDDIASIIHSQIPMDYDSAGVNYHFQTDGMFNLSAEANGKEVELTKNISIHYPQTSGVDGMNTYAFTNGRWNFEGTAPLTTYEEVCKKTVYRFNDDSSTPSAEEQNVIAELATISEDNSELEKDINELNAIKPQEPQKQNLNNYRFVLDVKPEEFPELGHFDDVIFEVKDSRFSYSIYDETWNDISVKKSPKEGRYLITLKNAKRLEIFDVYPVLSDLEFETAFNTYSEKMLEIELAKKDKSQQIIANKIKEEQFLASLDTYRAERRKLTKKNQIINALTADLTASSPFRSISVGSLGIVNFDTPIRLPAKGFLVPAEFSIAQSDMSVNAVSLIDIKDKTFYSFNKAGFSKFRFMRGKNYLLVTALPNGELAVYKNSLDETPLKRGVPHRFELELTPKYSTIEELQEYLGLSSEEV